MQRVSAEPGCQTAFVAFSAEKLFMMRASELHEVIEPAHIKRKPFDGEQCKTETDFYGRLTPT